MTRKKLSQVLTEAQYRKLIRICANCDHIYGVHHLPGYNCPKDDYPYIEGQWWDSSKSFKPSGRYED